MRLFALALLAFPLVGCDVSQLSLQPNIERAKYDQITGGMNADQVIAILGEPTAISENPDAGAATRYSRTYLFYDGSNVDVTIMLHNNVTARKFTSPDGEWDDSTEYNLWKMPRKSPR